MYILYRILNSQVEIIGVFEYEDHAIAISEKFGDSAFVSELPQARDQRPFDIKKWMKIYELTRKISLSE
jgi:hypothetical protein